MTECYFAVLSKQDYIRVLKKIDSKMMMKKVDFFHMIPFLKHYTAGQIKKLILSFNPLKYNINNIVYNQGD